NRAKCFLVVAPVSHKYVVIVWRSVAKAQPQARSTQCCQDGAVKTPCNNPMTNVPNDDTTKVSTVTVTSSPKTVCVGNGLSYRSCGSRGTLGLRLSPLCGSKARN